MLNCNITKWKDKLPSGSFWVQTERRELRVRYPEHWVPPPGTGSTERKMQTQECLWSWAGAKEPGQSKGCYPSPRSTGRTGLEHSGDTQVCKSHCRSVKLCCGEGAAISQGRHFLFLQGVNVLKLPGHTAHVWAQGKRSRALHAIKLKTSRIDGKCRKEPFLRAPKTLGGRKQVRQNLGRVLGER